LPSSHLFAKFLFWWIAMFGLYRHRFHIIFAVPNILPFVWNCKKFQPVFLILQFCLDWFRLSTAFLGDELMCWWCQADDHFLLACCEHIHSLLWLQHELRYVRRMFTVWFDPRAAWGRARSVVTTVSMLGCWIFSVADVIKLVIMISKTIQKKKIQICGSCDMDFWSMWRRFTAVNTCKYAVFVHTDVIHVPFASFRLRFMLESRLKWFHIYLLCYFVMRRFGRKFYRTARASCLLKQLLCWRLGGRGCRTFLPCRRGGRLNGWCFCNIVMGSF